MNPAQRRVLVRGAFVVGLMFGVMGINWLTDSYSDNDSRGLLAFGVSVVAVILALFVRAGGARQPEARPRERRNRIVLLSEPLDLAGRALGVVGMGGLLVLCALYGGQPLTPGIGFLGGVALAFLFVALAIWKYTE